MARTLTKDWTLSDFMGRVVISPTGCWVWQGVINRAGYGQLKTGKRKLLAHRHAYERLVGPIPDGLVIDHLCRNRACANPAHMEPVTNEENARRQVPHYSLKTHCKRGHPFAGDNLRMYRGGRCCRECERIKWRRKNAERSAARAAARAA